MAQNGQFWTFCRFFPIMRLRFIWNGHFHAINNFSHLLPPKHLFHLKSQKFAFLGGRYIGKFFEFFNFLDSFHTKLAKNDPQWQILPKKSVRLAQNGQFWSFCRFFPIISHNSLSFSTFLIPFTPNWLKMTHNTKFCQKKWVRLAQNGSSLRYLHFRKFHLSHTTIELISTSLEKQALF